jgi:hypothetical protein
LELGDKVNITYFCDVLIAKLVQALYPGGPFRGDEHFHCTWTMLALTILQGPVNLSTKQFIRLSHLPYSLDVASFDFYLSEMLKEKLKNCTVRTFDELRQEGDAILRSISEAELISVFETWLRRLQQVIDGGGENI